MSERRGARFWLAAIGATLSVLYLALNFLVLRAHGIAGRVGVLANPEAPKPAQRVEPAVGAEVLLVWKAHRPFGDTRRCIRAQLVRTDDDGRFESGWWLVPVSWPLKLPEEPEAFPVNEQGYRLASSPVDAAAAGSFAHVLVPAAGNEDSPYIDRMAMANGCRLIEQVVPLEVKIS